MKKIKWIKLIELLSIIIIPIIFLILLIPKIEKIMEEYRNIVYINTSKLIAVNAEKLYMENKLHNIDDTITCDDVIELDEGNYKSCSIYMDGNIAKVTLLGNGKYEGMNVCSGTKNDLHFEDNCDGICIMNKLVEVEMPYSIDNYDSCISYTKDLFINEREYTMDELNSFCKGEEVKGWSFSDNIEYMINKGYTERELAINNVIKGKINDLCIPNEVHVTCYQYEVHGEKGNWYAEITGYNDKCGNNIVIPDKIDGIKVEGIGESAFHGTNIYSVKFPNTIRYIENNAFRGLGEDYSDLNGAKIEGFLDMSNMDNLETIGYFAFADNKITEVKFPNNIKSIDGYSFSGNDITGKLDLSNTKLTIIGEYAFSSSNITSIKLPNSITTIGYTAFAGNKITGELDLSQYENLTTISGEAFAINEITSVKLPSNITIIGKDAFNNNKITGELDLSSYTNLKVINGFENNQITSIKLPESIISIGKNAFSSNNIEELDLSLNNNLKEINEYAFLNNKLIKVKLPESIEVIKENAFYKGEKSNSNLTTIINSSKKTFNWNNITTEGDMNTCSFKVGTCGSIKINHN